MGSLFFNKVAGALLAIFLVVLGLSTLAEGLFHTEGPETPVEEETGPPDFGVLLAGADLSAGERVARRCASCHTFEEGGADGTGPHMWGVIGRDVAAVDGFNYSSAMREYAEGGTEWMYQNMYDYLASPRNYVPGTAMSFAGLRDQADRINIIAYMRSLSNDPEPLPAPLESGEPAGAGEAMDEASEATEAMDETMGEPAPEGDAEASEAMGDTAPDAEADAEPQDG
jgi:cytochrome c